MTNAELLAERKARVDKAVSLEKTDRTPVVLEYAAFAARVTKTPMAEYVKNIVLSAETMIEAFEKVGGADGIDYESLNPRVLSLIWLSKVKLPGEELPADALWQVVEAELMKPDDYDRIVAEGWPNWMVQFIQERISADLLGQIATDSQQSRKIFQMWKDKGIPVLRGGMATIPYEIICGGRSMAKFMRDLYKIPDKVQSAMDAMQPFMAPQGIQVCKQFGLDYLWVGGWRSASAMLSQALWDRFVFPYYEKVINEVIAAGIFPILHFDSEWDRDLARFNVFPKGKCIFEVDGMTNIFKAKEVLGDTMCIMGDVPAAMLSLGTPDDVHKYSRKLIDELGPTGFILHSGCDIPIDAKLENVQAMVAAATGK